ncbi:CaiB/BaiF CoA transferase family protein [Pseudonocardia kunmingensis]|uniref:Crotonobetainyl-CoA:carnitine CoA-transferase CaiB-like acyl-CoA transferase n=1 Tax=Pseudonocardia kunmingensis TaxID=630975 RepID=A0A543DRE0_9PSEU|nr:CoA transferase [Pseudonocardia kunmingensis]TQM11864.1 crotonobetainyl-CoA:carnitine CoA-transferase CaiB-like acyl-CoA transferase [Pseudonocardia kunmingensis]
MTPNPTSTPRAGLLEGLRVLDLTNVLAGPYAAYQLALMGADVIKVETPHGGDLARRLGASPELSDADMGASFLAQNAAKRSIALDLKDERGKAAFCSLVAGSAVVVENFRPGVMQRLGLGWEQLREINPSLVYCAISGFGQTGPMRGRPAYDQIVQGLSGLMSVTGTPETAPLRVGAPVCDTLGGLAAAMSIAAALVRRHRTGEGAHLDVSMLEAGLTAMGWVVSDRLVAGQEPVAMGNENRTAAPSGTFTTADGHLNIAANKQEQYEALCAVLERPDLLADARFATREQRKQHRVALKAELEQTLSGRSAAEWDPLLTAAGVPAAPVATLAQALESPQLAARGLVAELPLPVAGRTSVRVLGGPVQVDGAPVRPTTSPPRLGEHTREILAELGWTRAEIDALVTAGGAV